MNTYFVYILCSKRNGTLYIGFTNDIERRMLEHKENSGSQFTSKYQIKKLVYFEEHHDNNEAFKRERQLKRWKRAWKINLIESENPQWDDLSAQWNLT